MNPSELIAKYVQWRKGLVEDDYPEIFERLMELEELKSEQSDD